MGYRSQVCIGISKEVLKDIPDSIMESFKDCDTINQNDKAVTFIWDDVKWYPSYKDVMAVDNMLANLTEDSEGEDQYGFIRVGEDDGDIESRGTPYEFGLQSCTSIEVDAGDEISKEDYFAANSLKFIKEDEQE